MTRIRALLVVLLLIPLLGWGAGQSLTEPAPMDYIARVLAGDIPGHRIINRFGERETMSNLTTGEDIWRGNELTPTLVPNHTTIPNPTALLGIQMSVVSEGVNDTAAGGGGTGAQQVTIEYLDWQLDEQTTTVEMDGVTEVQLTPSDVRFVNDFYVSRVGTNGVAANYIKIFEAGDDTRVFDMIAIGGNKSMVPTFRVPRNKKLHLRSWSVAESQNRRVSFRLRGTATPAGSLLDGIFLFKSVVYMKNNTASNVPAHHVIPAGAVVKVSGWGDVSLAEGSAHWWGVLVDD